MAKREAGRRNNSEGGIRQRPDGRWEATISLPDGKRRFFYARTKADALKKLQDAQAEVRAGKPLPPERLTVAAFLETWLTSTVPNTTRPATTKRYGELVRFHIIPSIGTVKLARLTPQDVERMARETVEDRGRSPRTAHHCRVVLGTALSVALRDGVVGRNVASLASSPRVPEFEPRRSRRSLRGASFRPSRVTSSKPSMSSCWGAVFGRARRARSPGMTWTWTPPPSPSGVPSPA